MHLNEHLQRLDLVTTACPTGRPDLSRRLLQPGGGKQVPGGSGRRVCPYQAH